MDEPTLIDLALSMYVGMTCPICKEEFKSVSDIRNRDPVCISNNPLILGCKKCVENKDYLSHGEEKEGICPAITNPTK